MFIQRLEQEQARLAHEALAKPAGRDAFEYGKVIGLYAGIEHAKQSIIAMFDDRERKDFNL